MLGVQDDRYDLRVAFLRDSGEAVPGRTGISGLDALARFVHEFRRVFRLIQRDVPRHFIVDRVVDVVVRIVAVSFRVLRQGFFITLGYGIDLVTPQTPVGVGHDPFFVLIGLRDRILARADDLTERFVLHALPDHQRDIVRRSDVVDFLRIQTVRIVVFGILGTDGFCFRVHHVAEGAHFSVAFAAASAKIPQILGAVIGRPEHHAVSDIPDLNGLAVGQLHGAAFSCRGLIHCDRLVEIQCIQTHEQVQDLRDARRIPFLVSVLFIEDISIGAVHHNDGGPRSIRRLCRSLIDSFICKRRHCPHKSQCRCENQCQ